MAKNKKNVALNRAIFTQDSFDSSRLTVLTTLFHRFEEAGNYDVYVHSGHRPVQRLHVRVSPEYSERQTNLDLVNLGSEKRGCDCAATACYDLAEGAVMGFYVSQGTAKYSVKVSQVNDEERTKRLMLNSREVVPAGDFFAVTLVRPGTYRATTSESKSEKRIYVRLPKEKTYRTEQASLVQVRKGGSFERRNVELQPGQTVVFQLESHAQVKVELVEPDDPGSGIPRRRPPGRSKPPRKGKGYSKK